MKNKYILYQDPAERQELYDNITKLIQQYAELRKVSTTEADQQKIETAEKATEEYQKAAESWIENDKQLRDTILPQMKTKGETVIATAQTAENEAWNVADTNGNTIISIVSKSKIIIIVALAIGVIIGIVLSFLITRSIANPVRSLSTAVSKFGQGNLNVEISKVARTDEIGILQNVFQDMAKNLREQTKEILDGVSILSSCAEEISTTVSQMAASAAETAASVSETTTTGEEVKKTTELSTRKAEDVSRTAQKTVEVSRMGEEAIRVTVESIEAIQRLMESVGDSVVKLSEQSQAIGDIIAAVDDIAEQSNLLAVNASIEAAKAGEHGKGFAVVAQEVRSLAEQSKQATSQVRTILNDIQKATGGAAMATEQTSKAVDAAVSQSAKVRESIRTLAHSINESAQAATQIAASSRQQFVGIEQVTFAMESIKQASIQSADGAKQLESAVLNLNRLGNRLKELVSHYQV